jgi:para-aminobenzoate synthetase component 1
MSFTKISSLASQGVPFLFYSDFQGKNVEVFPLSELEKVDIEYAIQSDFTYTQHPHFLQKYPIPFSEYKKKFSQVIEKIEAGETYILNLTQQTPIVPPLTLQEIFACANAHYKLRVGEKFVCFSPETFITISEDMIHTFPMKGTIDASLQDAHATILADEKEMAEHIMVVDLLRNDLSMVASKVSVERLRYVQKIHAGKKELLQVSSHISGRLPSNWRDFLGEILQTLLPAGSISGTPKRSTLSIIEQIEGYERGFFTGVFGVFDGEKLDSGVMIRFVEKQKDGYVYKSGGGITLESDAQREYQEMIDKIYLP